MNSKHDMANNFLEKKDYQKALQFYLDAVQERPNDGTIYQWIAKCYYELKKYGNALSASKEAIKLDENLFVPHLILAYIYHHQGELENALLEAQKAYDLSPQLEEASNCYGALLLSSGQIDESMTVLKRTLVTHPKSKLAHQNLAIAYKEKRDFKNHAEEMRLLYKYSPNLHTAMNLLIAYQQRYSVFLSLIVLMALLGALLIKSKIPLIIPAFMVIQGLLSDLGFVINGRWKRKGGLRTLLFSLITDCTLGVATSAAYIFLSPK